jgi:hypothetical protein
MIESGHSRVIQAVYESEWSSSWEVLYLPTVAAQTACILLSLFYSSFWQRSQGLLDF